MQYTSISLRIDSDSSMSPGRATRNDDGYWSGHVTVYLADRGALTIASDDPAALDELADALRNAAVQLDAARAGGSSDAA